MWGRQKIPERMARFLQDTILNLMMTKLLPSALQRYFYHHYLLLAPLVQGLCSKYEAEMLIPLTPYC